MAGWPVPPEKTIDPSADHLWDIAERPQDEWLPRRLCDQHQNEVVRRDATMKGAAVCKDRSMTNG